MFESLNTAGDSQRWSYNVHVETYGQCITDATAATISIVLNLKPIFASDSFYTRSVVRCHLIPEIFLRSGNKLYNVIISYV